MNAKKPARKPDEFPKRLREGHAEVTIYRQRNPSRRRNPETLQWEQTGKVFDEFVLAYYQGSRRVEDKATGGFKTMSKMVRQKFGSLRAAERQVEFVLTKLANGESDVLKLTGLVAESRALRRRSHRRSRERRGF